MRTVISLWRGEAVVPEPIQDIAGRVCAAHRVGIRDLRGSRGSKAVCEARRVIMAEAAADGHPHKLIADYLNRSRSDVTHAVNQWNGARA